MTEFDPWRCEERFLEKVSGYKKHRLKVEYKKPRWKAIDKLKARIDFKKAQIEALNKSLNEDEKILADLMIFKT